MTITHQESSKKTKFQTKKSFQGPNCKMWIHIRTKYPGVPSSGLQDEMSQDTISQDEIWTQPWRNIIRVTKLRSRWVHITGKMKKSIIHWRYRYCKLNIEMDRIYNTIWKLEYKLITQRPYLSQNMISQEEIWRHRWKTNMSIKIPRPRCYHIVENIKILKVTEDNDTEDIK